MKKYSTLIKAMVWYALQAFCSLTRSPEGFPNSAYIRQVNCFEFFSSQGA